MKELELFATEFIGDEHKPGGKKSYSLAPDVRGSAIFGGDANRYRYALKRQWDSNLPTVLFVMMNPSMASADRDDPTLRKVQQFARSWGFGSVLVGNVCAYRSTQPAELLKVADPCGPENEAYVLQMASEAQLIVFAYGKLPKPLRKLAKDLESVLVDAGHKWTVLKHNLDDSPQHPLYSKKCAMPQGG